MLEYSFRTPHGVIKITVAETEASRQIYVYLDPAGVKPGYVAITSTLAQGLNVDQNADGQVVGIEIY